MSEPKDISPDQRLAKRHRAVAGRAGFIALVMLGLAFASVPLYRIFCQATGFAGTTMRATAASKTVIDKTITVRFDGNVANGLAWKFEPVRSTIEVKLGETRVALYRAKNLSNKTIVGTATFNVAPESAGAYFNKLACFCFTEQTLKPGEEVEMPVSFFVDPAFATARETRGITQITLSYTFFPAENSKARADVGGKKKTGNRS